MTMDKAITAAAWCRVVVGTGHLTLSGADSDALMRGIKMCLCFTQNLAGWSVLASFFTQSERILSSNMMGINQLGEGDTVVPC